MESIGQGSETSPAEATTEQVEASPLDEFRNLLWSRGADEEAERRQWDADQVVRENLTAECMNDLGFDYIPWLNSQILTLPGDSWKPDDPDWVSQWGYGVVSSPPGAVSMRNTSSGRWDSPDNPNFPMYQEMTEAEQKIYRQAFTGGHIVPFLFTRTVDGYDFHDCSNWAYAVVNLSHVMWQRTNDDFPPLSEAINQMHRDLETEVTEADRDWANCMFDAGYPWFELQLDAQRYFKEIWQEFMSTWNWEHGKPNPTVSPEVAELQDQEIEMATTDLNCRISVDYTARRNTHIYEVENQFITDHKTALEALRAAAEQGQ